MSAAQPPAASDASGVCPATPEAGYRADTLTQSVMVLLAMTVLQRGIGLLRGILVCRWLDAESLGQWDMAFGFLNLAAPIAVLGISGSYGRYLEHFRQRGQGRSFLRSTLLVMAVLSAWGLLVLVVGRSWFSSFIFGRPGEENLVLWVTVCLASLILHNLLTELFGGMRLFRVVSMLQFCHSLAFAIVGLGLIVVWQPTAAALVSAFVVSCIVTSLFTWKSARSAWRGLPQTQPLPQRYLWRKLVPFAAQVWLTNWLANMFGVADRFLLLHFSGLNSTAALAMVGNYHSSLALAAAMTAVAGLLRSAILPHLSHDWEEGRKEQLAERLNAMLKFVGLGFTAGSLGLLVASPWLFELAFRGKYPDGLAVMPWTLTYLIWASLAMLASCYLWCAERAGLGSWALVLGLCVNVGLNLLLVPRFGLLGAVWATSAAHLTVVVLLYQYNRRLGMKIQLGTWIATLVPLSLPISPLFTAVVLVALLHQALTRNWLITAQQREQCGEMLDTVMQRLRRVVGL